MSDPKIKLSLHFFKKICFFIFIFTCSSLPFLGSHLGFCQENSQAANASTPTNPTEPDSSKIDPSKHIELGDVSVGISDPNGIKQEKSSGSTDLELGIIYKFRSKELIPHLMAPTFQAQPVVFSRAEKQNNQLDPNAAYGAGIKISADAEDSSLRWFLRLAAVTPRNDSPVNQNTSTSFEAMFGISIPLSRPSSINKLQRLRSHEISIEMRVPSILFENEKSMTAEQKKVIHSVYMSAFFGMMKRMERKGLPEENLRSETVAEDLVSFMKSSLFNPPLSYSDEDILLGRVAATNADKEEVLVHYLKPFLTDKLRKDYRFMLYSEGGQEQILLQVFPTYLSKKEDRTFLFNSEQMIDDFLSTTTEHLNYRLTDSQRD